MPPGFTNFVTIIADHVLKIVLFEFATIYAAFDWAKLTAGYPPSVVLVTTPFAVKLRLFPLLSDQTFMLLPELYVNELESDASNQSTIFEICVGENPVEPTETIRE